MKNTEFEIKNRSTTLGYDITSFNLLYQNASKLIIKEMPMKIRLLGIKLSNLNNLDNKDGEVISIDRYVDKNSCSNNRNVFRNKLVNQINCPICGERLNDFNNQLNVHIDKCLINSRNKRERETFQGYFSKKERVYKDE